MTLRALVLGRAALEAAVLACAAAFLHFLAAGREPLSIGAATLVAFAWVALLVALVGSEARPRRGVAVTLLALGGGAAAGIALEPRAPDLVALLGRIVAFGLLGEWALWRAVMIARAPASWSDALTASGLAVATIAIAALVPPLDRSALPVLALVVVAAAALTLALARAAEELDLAARARPDAGMASAGGVAVLAAAIALGAVLGWPLAAPWVASVRSVLGPLLERVVMVLALPFGYLAAWLIELLRPILPPRPQEPRPGPAVDPELQRQIEESVLASQPVVFGLGLVVLGAVGLLLALVLIERIARADRGRPAPGVVIERSREPGPGLLPTLAGLLAARRPPRPPADDGSPAAAVWLLYWRFLRLAEGRGAGWRADAETPAEHLARIGRGEPAWAPARPLVEAFERVRYGQRRPAPDEVERARAALREVTPRRA